jgi:hypothetical protein
VPRVTPHGATSRAMCEAQPPDSTLVKMKSFASVRCGETRLRLCECNVVRLIEACLEKATYRILHTRCAHTRLSKTSFIHDCEVNQQNKASPRSSNVSGNKPIQLYVRIGIHNLCECRVPSDLPTKSCTWTRAGGIWVLGPLKKQPKNGNCSAVKSSSAIR